MEYLTILLSVLAVLIGYYYYTRRWKLFERYGIPHIPPKLIVGNMGPMVKRQCSLVDLMKKVYYVDPEAKYVGFYDFRKPMIFVRDVELIKDITLRSANNFLEHEKFFDTEIDTLMGDTLFFQKGEYWKSQRALLTPLFTSSKLKSMFNMMEECAARYADYMCHLPENEQELETKALIYKFANDVVASCVLGIEMDTIKNPNNRLYEYGNSSTLFSGFGQYIKTVIYKNAPMVTKLFGIKFLKPGIENYFKNLIKETVMMRENGVYRPDMLQTMMETKNHDGSKLSIPKMTSNAFGFYFATCEAISLITSFVLHMLAQYPEEQVKVQEEVDRVLEEHEGRITYDSSNKLEYLEAVIYETQRLYSAAAYLDRLCTKDYQLPPAVPGAKPFTVKAGMLVWVPVCAIHTDPQHFENPEKFEPERFINDKRILTNGTYMPFGFGPRQCIGTRFAMIKLKTLIAHVMSRCNVKFGPKSHRTLELMKGSIGVVPEHGFWLTIEPRNKGN